MPVVAFVILHYLAFDVTVRCIESICNTIAYKNYRIVVVDNGSDNNSGKTLKELYVNEEKISIICLDSNRGFSAGNNVGYRYAREKLGAKYIIVINNDTELIQKDFITAAINTYEYSHYYVLGPDIVNLEGIHQSPQRDHIITQKEAIKWLIIRSLFSAYLHMHRFFHLSESSAIIQMYMKHEYARKVKFTVDKQQNYVELQGACFIFSPLFVKESEIAFEELTFMYGEEALLALRCKKNEWKILYNPELKILHAEKVVTNVIHKDVIDKEIFYSDNLVRGIWQICKKCRIVK